VAVVLDDVLLVELDDEATRLVDVLVLAVDGAWA
jgi:hypothetical protein